MANNDPWDLGGGGESFPFDHVGDEVEGFIQDMVDRQGTDLDTGELAWWDKEQTRPVMLKIVTLQTTLKENPADDGKRNVTLSGSKKPNPDGTMSKMAAALSAVKSATGGGTAFQFNAWFKMRFSSEGARTKPAFSPPKYYQAWYRPAVMDLDGPDQTNPVNQVPETWGSQQPAPAWAQQTGENYQQQTGENYQQQPAQVAQGGTLAGETITAAAVEAIRKAGMNPDTVFGPGWQARVVG
jgi:hypothetical protein